MQLHNSFVLDEFAHARHQALLDEAAHTHLSDEAGTRPLQGLSRALQLLSRIFQKGLDVPRRVRVGRSTDAGGVFTVPTHRPA
jgi:hypothetical protein